MESNLPAVLCHSGVVAWASHLETGNLVLDGPMYARRGGYIPPFHAFVLHLGVCYIFLIDDLVIIARPLFPRNVRLQSR